MNNPTRTGIPREGKRLVELSPQANQLFFEQNGPTDPNKDGRGSINYDPIYGWTGTNSLGGESVGISEKYSTIQYNRLPGLPGSKP